MKKVIIQIFILIVLVILLIFLLNISKYNTGIIDVGGNTYDTGTTGSIGTTTIQNPPTDNGSIGGGDGSGVYACTMDAKICPDGSAVGRTGPKCEFQKCPGE